MIEKIKNFDKKLEQYERNNIIMAKIVRYLVGILWIPILLIPIQEFDKEFRMIFLFGYSLSVAEIALLLSYYMNIPQQGKETVSVYEILNYTPVDLQTIFYVRLGYLSQYCKKKVCLYLLLQVSASFLILKTISIWNFLFPIFWVLIASFLPGFFMIYFKKGIGSKLSIFILFDQYFFKKR